jgi:hypothetical protein
MLAYLRDRMRHYGKSRYRSSAPSKSHHPGGNPWHRTHPLSDPCRRFCHNGQYVRGGLPGKSKFLRRNRLRRSTRYWLRGMARPITSMRSGSEYSHLEKSCGLGAPLPSATFRLERLIVLMRGAAGAVCRANTRSPAGAYGPENRVAYFALSNRVRFRPMANSVYRRRTL